MFFSDRVNLVHVEEKINYLVVGLGNPGRSYEGTYHNVGRECARLFVKMCEDNPSENWIKKFHGIFTEINSIQQRIVYVLLPQTYMNLSGKAVKEAVKVLGVSLERVIVVHDDMDIESGRVKIKFGGSHGGHRGVLSCIEHLNSEKFIRVKIGIGKDPGLAGMDYVLSKIYPEHSQVIHEGIEKASRAIKWIVLNGLQSAMNEFNRKKTESSAKNENNKN